MKDFIILCAKIALGIFIVTMLILGTSDDSLYSKTKNVMQQSIEYQKNY